MKGEETQSSSLTNAETSLAALKQGELRCLNERSADISPSDFLVDFLRSPGAGSAQAEKPSQRGKRD